MRRPRLTISLNDDERRTLDDWARAPEAQGSGSGRRALRAQMVLLCAEGLDDPTIAARLGTGPTTVAKWRARFVRDRLAGLDDSARAGVPRRITDAQIEEVVRRTLERTPPGGLRWTRRSMAKATGLSRSTIDRLWRAFGLAPERRAPTESSLCLDRVRAVVGLCVSPGQHALALAVDDEGPPEGGPLRLRPLGPLPPDAAEGDRQGLGAAMHALLLGGEPTPVQQKRPYRLRPAVELLRFLEAAARAVPAGLGLHVVLDGHRAHQEEALRTFAARHPRLEVHVAPSHDRFLELAARVLALSKVRAQGGHAALT